MTTRFDSTVLKVLPVDRHHKPLYMKAKGKPIAGDPHGGFDVAGIGNVSMVQIV